MINCENKGGVELRMKNYQLRIGHNWLIIA